jgi:hypothetical protein
LYRINRFQSRDFGFGRRIEYRDDDPTYWTKKEAQPESRWPSPFSVSDGSTYTSSNRGPEDNSNDQKAH